MRVCIRFSFHFFFYSWRLLFLLHLPFSNNICAEERGGRGRRPGVGGRRGEDDFFCLVVRVKGETGSAWETTVGTSCRENVVRVKLLTFLRGSEGWLVHRSLLGAKEEKKLPWCYMHRVSGTYDIQYLRMYTHRSGDKGI